MAGTAQICADRRGAQGALWGLRQTRRVSLAIRSSVLTDLASQQSVHKTVVLLTKVCCTTPDRLAVDVAS
jgi:hypothetical protein